MPHGFWRGEAFGVRQLAAAFKRTLEKQALWAAFKSGSKLPHSKGALRARKLTNRSLEKTKPALAVLLNKVLYNTKYKRYLACHES